MSRNVRQRPASQVIVGGATAVSTAELEVVRAHHARSIDDAFFRHIVSGMRNGVLAITRDGRLAVINDEAYRIFGVTPQADDPGQPLAAVLVQHPDVVRVLCS